MQIKKRLEIKNNSEKDLNPKYMDVNLAAKMKLRKHGDWIEYVTEKGKTFYYNEKNGDFQWVAPTPGKGKIIK